MQYFLGVVPPENIYRPVIKLQRQFGDNRIEPHITVKGPGGIPENRKWIEPLKKIINDHPPLKIKISGTAFFGYDVLFLTVISNDVIALHNKLVKFFNPDDHLLKEFFEGNYFVPHLTVAHSSSGYSRLDLIKMKKIIDDTFNTNISFEAEFLRVYLCDEFNSRSSKFEDIDFKKA
jgi:2'-5' RNA ligase